MANTKSAIKRIRRISRQTIVNKSRKSKFKNAIKKMNILLDTKKKKDALKKRRGILPFFKFIFGMNLKKRGALKKRRTL